MRSFVLGWMAALFAACCGWAAERADFVNGTGTNGWTVGAKEWRSPDYGSAVDQISLEYGGSAAAGSATIYATPQEGGEAQQIAIVNGATSAAAFYFPDTTAFRSFRIAADGEWGLRAFSAVVSASSLEAPSNVSISNNVTGTSFDAYWTPVADATGYRTYVWTNAVVGASAGTVLWQETMPGATNASSSTKLTDAKFGACFANVGWTRSDKAGYPTGEDGTIRIGTSGDNGWIQTPQIYHAEEGVAVRFHAKANAANTKSMDVAVERVSGETATLVGTATLTTEMQEFTVVLSDWTSGDCIRFNSITNGDRRTTLGSVALVSGYSEGQEEPACIVNGLDVGNVTEYSFSGLPPDLVFFAVEAYGKRGVSSVKTVAVQVDLANPDKTAALNACPLSSLTDKTYAQNFDSLAYVKSTSAAESWFNGMSLQYWQAFQNGTAIDGVILYKGGNATGAKFLVLATNENDTVRALGARLNQSTTTEWGIVFTNDTDSTITLSGVSYAVEQWGFANTTNQILTLSCLVTNELKWIAEYVDGWVKCTETTTPYLRDDVHSTFEVVNVEYEPESAIRVAPGEVLVLKWTFSPPAAGNSAIMAIDDLEVRFTAPKPLVIRIARQ